MKKPSEMYNIKIVGKIIAQIPNCDELDHFDVIAIEDFFYVCDKWYKEGVPQLVPKEFVIEFKEID